MALGLKWNFGSSDPTSNSTLAMGAYTAPT